MKTFCVGVLNCFVSIFQFYYGAYIYLVPLFFGSCDTCIADFEREELGDLVISSVLINHTGLSQDRKELKVRSADVGMHSCICVAYYTYLYQYWYN